MRSFARGTQVPVDRSRFQIEHLLAQAGAERFAYATSATGAAIGFRINGRNIKIMVPMPDLDDRNLTHNKAGYVLTELQVKGRFEQEIRRRWRALLLVIKAKLEAVESGIAEFEVEFMPYIVLPGGATVAEKVLPNVAEAYASKKNIPMLGSGI